MLLIQSLTIKTQKNNLENEVNLEKNQQKIILQDFELKVKSGIIGITGQNGSGKSTLAKVLVGIEVEKLEISGKIEWQNQDLLNLSIVQGAKMGIFLAFQNAPIIKGISTLALLKVVLENKLERENLELETLELEMKIGESNLENKLQNSSKNNLESQQNNQETDNLPRLDLEINQKESHTQIEKIDKKSQNPTFNSPKIIQNYTKKIFNIIKENANKLQIGNLYRQRMENLSGGERKKMEILQLLCLEPSLVILDEVDSGLDELSVVLIAKVLREFAGIQKNRKLPILLVISHNSHFLSLLGCAQIIKIEKL